MNIEHRPGEHKGRFVITEDGKELGEMTYVVSGPDRITIDHTEGFPGSEGKGVGRKLVMASVEYARANGLKIIPLCPFAKKVFERNADELADVRA